MRLVYLGTPAEAVPPLTALVETGHDIALVVTQPDRRRGRGGVSAPSPVKQAATELGLSVVTPQRAAEILDDIRGSGADMGVVVAFGQLLPPELLEALPMGFVNLHFSLLPRWRGAAPVERAILAGDAETGVCLMRMEEGLDTGGVLASTRLAIGEQETAGELMERLVDVGTQLLVEHIVGVSASKPSPQAGEPTYARKLTVEEFEIDWARRCEEIARLVRAGNPRPGAWTTAEGRRLKVLRVHEVAGTSEASPGELTGEGAVAAIGGDIHLDEVQPEGKAPMTGAAWLAGFRGTALGG